MLGKLSCRCSLWFKFFFLTVTLGMESLLLTLSIPPLPLIFKSFGAIWEFNTNFIKCPFMDLNLYSSAHFLLSFPVKICLATIPIFALLLCESCGKWASSLNFFYGSIFRLFKLKFYLTHKLFYFRLTLTIQALSFGTKLCYLPPYWSWWQRGHQHAWESFQTTLTKLLLPLLLIVEVFLLGQVKDHTQLETSYPQP